MSGVKSPVKLITAALQHRKVATRCMVIYMFKFSSMLKENSLQNYHRMIACMHKKISIDFVDLEETLALPVSKPARSPSSAATHAFSLLSSHFTQTGFCSSPLVKNLPSSNCPPHSYIRISTLPIHLRDENSPHNKNTAHATPPPTHSQPHQ